MRRSTRFVVLAPGVFAFFLVPVAGTQTARTPPREAERDEERVERPVPFSPPAPQMRKLAFLVGTWELRETWNEPKRYKRGRYEGYPGEEGIGEEKIHQGPGNFSLLWDYEARGPMGHVTARAILSWDPARGVYDYFQVHSALPGALRLTGRLENGSLVFRGEDERTGEKTSVRLVIETPSTSGWTEIFEQQRRGGSMERVVTTVVRRATKGPETAPRD
jgi:hypothetical protein